MIENARVKKAGMALIRNQILYCQPQKNKNFFAIILKLHALVNQREMGRWVYFPVEGYDGSPHCNSWGESEGFLVLGFEI